MPSLLKQRSNTPSESDSDQSKNGIESKKVTVKFQPGYYRTEHNFYVNTQKNMATSEVKKCMDWLCKEQGEMESAPFGQGKLGVHQALATQQSKVKDIMKFKGNLEQVLQSEKVDGESAKELSSHLNSVEALSQKRESCLEVIGQIASLEDLIQNVSSEFSSRAVHIVNTSEITKQQGGTSQSNESLARTAQNCISSVRKNWQWMFQIMQCAEVHLRNAAAYQQYFQEVDEAEYWMNTTLSRIHLSFNKSNLEGSYADAQSMVDEIRDVLAAYLQWQTKIDYLFDKAKEVIPVPLRIKTLKDAKPVVSLTNFDSDDLSIIEGETLTLLDNSDEKKWKVKKCTGAVGQVPAVIVLIPPPSGPAIDASIRLRLQLLSLWTNSVKRLGYQMIAFMLLVFKDWSDEEVKLLQSMFGSDKEELMRILHYIESELIQHWSGYPDFEELQERITRLKMILEESSLSNGENGEFSTSVIVQIKMLETLLRKYKDFWTFWETYKCVAELLRQPKYLLVCDKWEQLRFMSTAHFVKFWDTELDMAKMTVAKDQTARSLVCHETPKEPMPGTMAVSESMVQSTASASYSVQTPEVSSEVCIEEEKEETTTDTVTTSLEEEQQTYLIKGVIDPRDDKTQLTLQQAVMLGIVDQDSNKYINPNTGASMSMPDAMNEGRIMMEIVSRKKIREENNSYGIMTIKTTKETRDFTITGVIDPATEEKLTVSQAAERNIIDAQKTTYRTEKGEQMAILDAVHSGLVMVEYHDDESQNQHSDVVEKTYAVYGVVDQKKKAKVSFGDAMRDCLLDRDTGEYINNVTNVKVPAHEAIMRGFIKARVVADPSKLEMNPENTIIVEKLNRTKNKIRSAMKLASALKSK